ncbi:hypothetical protein Q5752_003167 [Cryptotrichosporon argae]
MRLFAFLHKHFVALPQDQPLEHIRVPPHYKPYSSEHGWSTYEYNYHFDKDAVPLLSMDHNEHPVLDTPTISADTIHAASTPNDYRIRAAALSELVPTEALVAGKTWDQLALYEKKSVLVGRELDQLGMGRYQWSIFFLCGFGYFLDLAWSQVTGLVAAAVQQELGISDSNIGNLSVAFNTGLTIGAFAWGLLVDVYGRRWCFNLTCLIASVFGFMFAAPSNFHAICLFNALIGLGVGGNIPIDATITMEFLPTNRRFLLAALSAFQPLGVVAASLICLGLIPKYSCDPSLPACSTGQQPCCTRSSNIGWRYTMTVLGSITLFIFILRFLVFKFQESPRFLLAKGHDAHALDVLYAVAKFNGAPLPNLSLDDFQALDHEEAQKGVPDSDAESFMSNAPMLPDADDRIKKVALGGVHKFVGHLHGLVNTRSAMWLFISMATAYMSLFWSFSIAGQYLPLILRARGIDTDMSVEDAYRSYVWIYLPGITATGLAAYLMRASRVGRKWSMVIAAGLQGASLILYQVVNSRAANIGFNAMEYWFQRHVCWMLQALTISLYAALLYAYTPEAFPAPVRGSASGIMSTLGRIASIVAPLAAGTVYHGGTSPGVLYLAGGAAWVSMFAIACLPKDTNGKQTM